MVQDQNNGSHKVIHNVGVEGELIVSLGSFPTGGTESSGETSPHGDALA